MHLLKLLLIVIPFTLAVDLLYLGVLMKDFYSRELGDLARRDGASLSPRWGAALLVYLLIPCGLVLFIRPLLGPTTSWLQALGYGAAFGLVVYGVYDLTNLATLEKWTVRLAAADMAWGCVLCGLVGLVTWGADRWLRS